LTFGIKRGTSKPEKPPVFHNAENHKLATMGAKTQISFDDKVLINSDTLLFLSKLSDMGLPTLIDVYTLPEKPGRPTDYRMWHPRRWNSPSLLLRTGDILVDGDITIYICFE